MQQIKIHIRVIRNGRVCTEHLGAIPIGEHYAQIHNVPFAANFLSFGDVVSIDECQNIISIVIKNQICHCVQPKKELSTKNQQTIKDYFLDNRFRAEFHKDFSYYVISCATNIGLEEIQEIVENCPVKSELIFRSSKKNLKEDIRQD